MRTRKAADMFDKEVTGPDSNITADGTRHAVTIVVILQALACADGVLELLVLADAFHHAVGEAQQAEGGCLGARLVGQHVGLSLRQPELLNCLVSRDKMCSGLHHNGSR